ncbi:MAG: hypothetical protein ABI885_15070 [Gammaproteobacteria bacterium]
MIYRHPASRLIIAALIALSLALLDSETAIAAESGTSSKGIEVNACTLLSADEISAAVHFKVEDGVRNDSGQIQNGSFSGSYSSTCLWTASEDHNAKDPSLPLGGARFVILNVMSGPAGSQHAANFLQGFRDAADDQTIRTSPVSLSIGDDSLWWGDGVAVQKGDISYGVSVHSVNQRSLERQMEETLASKIVKRL